jgi:hypothetical protein
MKLIEYQSLVNSAQHKLDRQNNEELLLKEIKNIKNRLENSILFSYHAIGAKINEFYNKCYGKNEMARIAKTLDLSISTVYKIVQFAEKYDQHDVVEISEGTFQLSWHRLRDNLSLRKEDVLSAYRSSHHPYEFSKKIGQLKRIVKAEKNPDNNVAKASEEESEFCPRVLNFQCEASDGHISQVLKNLQAEVTRLQSELDQKNRQIKAFLSTIRRWRAGWIAKFPEMLRDLDQDTLLSLECSLIEEKQRRMTRDSVLFQRTAT